MRVKKIYKGLIYLGVIFLAIILVNGCYYDEYLPEEEETVIIDPGTTISFASDVIPIFNASCNSVGCHNSGGISPNLTAQSAYVSLITGNYIDSVAPENSELYQWMRGNRSLPMPLTGPNAQDNAIILAWIEQGASDN